MLKFPSLLAAIILGAWLLRKELRRHTGVSKAIWIPTLLIMVLSSRPLSSWIQGGAIHRSSGLIDELFLAFALGAPLVLGSMRGVNWGRFFAANLPLVFLYVYFAATSLWSDDPAGSATRIAKDFGLLFVIGLIYSERQPMQAIRAVFIRCACVLFPLSIVFNRYFPTFGRDFGMGSVLMHTGVTTQKNALGEIVFVFSIFVLWDYVESPAFNGLRGLLKPANRDYLLIFLMGGVLLMQSQSKTALVCLLLASSMMLRTGKLASRFVSTAAYMVALSTPFLFFFTQGFVSAIAPIVEALGRDTTFTGRTGIWEHITSTTVNPLIGCGYWTFWQGPRGLAISEEVHWPIPTAHCGYLDLYLDGGAIGLFALLVVLVAYGARLIRKRPMGRAQLVGLALLCAAVIYNLSESSFVRIGPLWFSILVMMVEFPQKKRSVAAVQGNMTEIMPPPPPPVSEPIAARRWV